MNAALQVIDTLNFNIAQLKQKISTMPQSSVDLYFSAGKSRRVLEIECAALEELAQAIELSQGKTVVHAFWGRCTPDLPEDVARYVGMLKTYQAQAKAGMCCLLRPYLGAVDALVESLSAPKAA